MKPIARWFWLFFAVLLVIPAQIKPVQAQTAPCDSLGPEQQKTKKSFFAAMHPYAGCDQNFTKCLAKKPPSPVVLRLASDICRKIKAGKTQVEIERALTKRAQSMLPMGKPATIAIDDSTRTGDPEAPIQVVVYACARCPFCSKIVPAIYRAVNTGSLKGKVKVYFRPFPLKDHAGSTEGGLAMVSGARLGGFWPLVLIIYERYDAFCPKKLAAWAEEVGLDRQAYEAMVADPETRQALIASKKEGVRNKVKATPTIFIDGRRYKYEMKIEALLDVLEEAFETRQTATRQELQTGR